MFSFDDQNIWDEYQWEDHINEITRRHQHLRGLMELHSDQTPRWLHHIKDFPTKLDAVDAFVEEELLIEESSFPFDEEDFDEFDEVDLDEDDLDEDDLDEDDLDEQGSDIFLFHRGEVLDEWNPDDEDGDFTEHPIEGDDFLNNPEDDEDDDYDDLESLFEDIFDDESSDTSGFEYSSLENIAIYTDARDLAASLLIFYDSKPHYLQHAGFVRLVSESLHASTRLAAAYSMGFDLEVLGANIAYCKKALETANQTLLLLQGLKDNPLNNQDYYEIHRALFELRNNIGIHIQETRDLFYSQV